VTVHSNQPSSENDPAHARYAAHATISEPGSISGSDPPNHERHRGCSEIARRWATLAWVLGLFSFAAAAGALLAWNVGSPIEQGVDGAFMSVGEVGFHRLTARG
jgi:hypothetical protein